MGLTNNLEEILQAFKVYGFVNDRWEDFEKGKEYEAFGCIPNCRDPIMCKFR
jgi:hypothetical protein